MNSKQLCFTENILIDVQSVDVNVGKLDDSRLVLDSNQLYLEVTILMFSDCLPPGYSTLKGKPAVWEIMVQL